MTDRTERQERDEATGARDPLTEADGLTSFATDQTVGPETIAAMGCENEVTPASAPKARRATCVSLTSRSGWKVLRKRALPASYASRAG